MCLPLYLDLLTIPFRAALPKHRSPHEFENQPACRRLRASSPHEIWKRSNSGAFKACAVHVLAYSSIVGGDGSGIQCVGRM
jgi:hypothetical protein